ncbi:MAG: radical SAM/SPASM domain-containing protein [Deltaproteobacteria bacterium]
MAGISPSILHFHITSRCPHYCRHCCSDSGPERTCAELDGKAIRRMLDRAARFGMEEFELSGGEPLVVGRNRILEGIGYASSLGLLTTLNTNAWYLDEGYILDLKDAGLDRVKSSLYGTSCITHDDFTQKQGSFKRVKDVLGLLRENEIEVWINYVVTPRNIDEASGLPRLLVPYTVDTIQLSSIVPSGRGEGARDYVFSDGELRNVTERLEGVFPNAKGSTVSYTITLWKDPEKYPFGDRYCDYLRDRLVVDPSGHVIPCCVLPSRLKSRAGNIVEEELDGFLAAERLEDKPVFYWLGRGHKAMRERLQREGGSSNLCSSCIKMLTTLCNNGNGNV